MQTGKIVRVGLFVAMSGLGGVIKIPSPTGTVAFDSLPGYLAAAIFGGPEAALIGALGHLFSAWTVSFPLGLPLHLLVAVQMAVWVSVFGYLFRKGLSGAAVVTAVILNGVVAPVLLVPILGPGVFAGLVLPLVVGSVANVVPAAILGRSQDIRRAVRGIGL